MTLMALVHTGNQDVWFVGHCIENFGGRLRVGVKTWIVIKEELSRI